MQDKCIHVVLRSTAKQVGLKRYFPASECKHGHTGERYTITGQCIACFEGRGRNPERVAYMADYREARGEELLQKKREHYAENREEIRRRAKDAYYANPEKARSNAKKSYLRRREKAIAYSMQYYYANWHKCRQRAKEYYQNNKEAHNARAKAWFKKNPGASTATRHKRRAAEGKYTAKDIRRIFELQRGRCAFCSVKLPSKGKNRFHVDHIMPISKGGTNWPDNIQLLCPFCNLSKHAKHPIDSAQENGRLL